MLHNMSHKHIIKNLVYIPYGAEKGDCPHCYTGVLRRDESVQKSFRCKEGYICAKCGAVFLETNNRYFVRVAVWKGLFERLRRV